MLLKLWSRVEIFEAIARLTQMLSLLAELGWGFSGMDRDLVLE